jgi:hypothetical protein
MAENLCLIFESGLFFSLASQDFSVLEMLLVVLWKAELKHVVEEGVLSATLSYSAPFFQVRVFVHFVGFAHRDDIAAEANQRLAMNRLVSAMEITESAFRNLDVSRHKVVREARLEFHHLSFKHDVVGTHLEKLFWDDGGVIIVFGSRHLEVIWRFFWLNRFIRILRLWRLRVLELLALWIRVAEVFHWS